MGVELRKIMIVHPRDPICQRILGCTITSKTPGIYIGSIPILDLEGQV